MLFSHPCPHLCESICLLGHLDHVKHSRSQQTARDFKQIQDIKGHLGLHALDICVELLVIRVELFLQVCSCFGGFFGYLLALFLLSGRAESSHRTNIELQAQESGRTEAWGRTTTFAMRWQSSVSCTAILSRRGVPPLRWKVAWSTRLSSS